MQLIDGKFIADTIKQEIAQSVEQMIAEGKKRPHLAAILVGHDGGSETYVAHKVKACEQCGFESTLIRYEDDVTEQELLATIQRLNEDESVDGFIVQLPLPKHISEQRITEAIDFRKDVDGFHPINVGRLSIGLPCFVSATPSGIIELLRRYNIDTKGKHCVVLGRSNIVGKPMVKLLLDANATVTIAHSRTQNLAEVCREADILVAAVGRKHLITADMIKPGAIVIDVGVNRDPETGKLCGDVDTAAAQEVASFITPVPGGVGPMTITMLMKNTIECYLNRIVK